MYNDSSIIVLTVTVALLNLGTELLGGADLRHGRRSI